MQTKTMSKVNTKIVVGSVVGVALIGGAIAYAAAGYSSKTYQGTYVQCHDGTSVTTPVGECRTSKKWKRYARSFCYSSAPSPTTGKRGVNTYKLGRPCTAASSPASGPASGPASSMAKDKKSESKRSFYQRWFKR